MSNLESVTAGSIEMIWDADSRLATLHFTRETHATGKEAVPLVEALSRWIGADGKPFALLGDGSKLHGVDSEYRSVWGTFVKQHRKECYLAFFNVTPVMRIAVDMFRMATRLQLKTCGDEREARSWLRQKGIPA